jgi:hypothetical protein
MNVKLDAKDIIEMIVEYYKVVKNLDVEIIKEFGANDYYGYGKEVKLYIKYQVGFGKYNATGKDMLTNDDIIEVLNYFLKGNQKVDNIRLLIKENVTGYGYAENYDYVFDGINVEFKQKVKVKQFE